MPKEKISHTLKRDYHEKTPDSSNSIQKGKETISNEALSDVQQKPSFDLALIDIEYKTSDNHFEAIIETNESDADYNSFLLPDPPRIVIDLSGSWNNEAKQVYNIDTDKVKKIRTWIHADKLRIVIDLTDTEPLSHVLEKSTRGLSLIINSCVYGGDK